eukprot:gb/GECG01003610.1/.p1 GENE.gb/GECG01003610.1/~~gb/GECG01003610.1/.p1  ORF type:complete len:581 (+),score=50.33 gb/GECG01003610.1/:1-1743(+)
MPAQAQQPPVPWRTLIAVLVAMSASSYNIPTDVVVDTFTHYLPNLAALSSVGVLTTFHPIAPVDYVAKQTIPNFLETVEDRYFDHSPPDPRVVYRHTVPTVLNVPLLERIEFFVLRFWNYFALQFLNMPFNMWYSRFNHRTTPIEDEEFSALFMHHWPSAFLQTLNYSSPPQTAEGLPEFIKALRISEHGGEIFEWYYVQFPGMATWAYTREHNKMFYGAGSFVIFRRPRGSAENLEPYAIELFGECMRESYKNDGNHPRYQSIIVRPGDPAWDASKTFVIHGASHYYVLAEHPMAHFPFDVINGGIKDRRIMPVFHPLRPLLKPHFRFTLTLNDFVMNSFATSIALNEYLVHCFDASGPESFQLIQEYTKKYNFSEHRIQYFPPQNPSNMSVFLLEYRSIIENFVRRVVEYHRPTGEFQDAYVQDWADHVSKHLPGFPNGREILDEEVMIDTLTEIIFDLSVHHSTQHWNYHTSLEMKKRPWRIRHRPPLSKDDPWDWKAGSHTQEDVFTYAQTEIMFFFPGPYTILQEVEYQFDDPQLQAIAKDFAQQLKVKDNQLKKTKTPVYQLAPLDKLGPSIDY